MKDEDANQKYLDPDASPLEEETPKYLDPEESPLDGSLRLPDLVKSAFGNAETFGIDELSYRRVGDQFEIFDGTNYREMSLEENIELRRRLEKSRG